MKFPKLVSLISSIVAMTGPQRLALDAALDAKAKDAEMPDAAEDAYEREEACDEREAACDAREQSMDEAEKNPDTEVARGDRKKARDARKGARDARAKDRKIAKDKAKDAEPMLKKEGAEDVAAAVDAAIKAGGFVTQAEAQRLAADAVARVEGIAQAKRDVAPLVGEIAVAMDSADSIYRFALDQVKVEHKGIHASALPAVVAAEVRVRKGAPRPANDGVSLAAGGFSIEQIFAAPQA